jgi:hypothetical protein
MGGLVSADDVIGLAVVAAVAMVEYADVFVETIEMGPVMKQGSGGPVSLVEGGVKWNEAADKFQEAQQALQTYVGGISHDYWDGDDRNAFDTEMTQLQAQLGDSHNYAMTVGIVLDALAVPIGLWPIMCTTIGLVEFAFASAFYVAAASVIGDLGASEAIYAAGEAATTTCFTVLNASMTIMITVMAAATAAIVISDAADVGEQEKNGDTTALSDFGKATVTSLPEVGFNLLVDHLNNKGEGGEDEPHEGGEGGGEGGGGAPTSEGGQHEDPQGRTATDSGDGPGAHEDPSDEPGPDTSPEDTSPEDTTPEDTTPGDDTDSGGDTDSDGPQIPDYVKEKAREHLGDAAGGGLSSLINGLIGPSDQPPEKWGAEPETESV